MNGDGEEAESGIWKKGKEQKRDESDTLAKA